MAVSIPLVLSKRLCSPFWNVIVKYGVDVLGGVNDVATFWGAARVHVPGVLPPTPKDQKLPSLREYFT